jgi:hypothetical protein
MFAGMPPDASSFEWRPLLQEKQLVKRAYFFRKRDLPFEENPTFLTSIIKVNLQQGGMVSPWGNRDVVAVERGP